MSEYCVVLTTLGNHTDAQTIIDNVLESNLAACIQTFDINSHYRWKGEICHDPEVMILFKTTWERYYALESRIKELHPYDTPEIIAIDIEKGCKEYLEWIKDSL